MTDRRLGILKATMEPGTGDGEMHFTASAEGINRHGFSLRKSGWRLDNYNLNPVFLWMHMDFMPPIGRGRAVLRARAPGVLVEMQRPPDADVFGRFEPPHVT